MGMASSLGLGLALARPDRRVIVCDGDGSLLMNLGALATVGTMRPPNLTVVVWDNGEYRHHGRTAVGHRGRRGPGRCRTGAGHADRRDRDARPASWTPRSTAPDGTRVRR